ncbi:hypothetical protein [Persephonella sp.]
MNKEFFSVFDIYTIVIDYLQIFLFLFVSVTLLLTIYTTHRFLKLPISIKIRRKKEDHIKIDLKNSKETAYTITFLIHRYDTPYNTKLLKNLEKFKYKKHVENLDEETVQLINNFLEHIREHGNRI